MTVKLSFTIFLRNDWNDLNVWTCQRKSVLQPMAPRYFYKDRTHHDRADSDDQTESREFADMAVVPQLPDFNRHDKPRHDSLGLCHSREKKRLAPHPPTPSPPPSIPPPPSPSTLLPPLSPPPLPLPPLLRKGDGFPRQSSCPQRPVCPFPSFMVPGLHRDTMLSSADPTQIVSNTPSPRMARARKC